MLTCSYVVINLDEKLEDQDSSSGTLRHLIKNQTSVHLLGIMNVHTKFHGHPFKSYPDFDLDQSGVWFTHSMLSLNVIQTIRKTVYKTSKLKWSCLLEHWGSSYFFPVDTACACTPDSLPRWTEGDLSDTSPHPSISPINLLRNVPANCLTCLSTGWALQGLIDFQKFWPRETFPQWLVLLTKVPGTLAPHSWWVSSKL